MAGIIPLSDYMQMPGELHDEIIRMYYGRSDTGVTVDRKTSASAAMSAERVADEIMARIERDGAIHRSSLIEVISREIGR